ncbi:P-loop containing nucleoside triphosphate hydrolase protein [Basidiobolus meristosporus CBS 931.73]|uniref:p-loop containing nucleoside triphosphate hydrolase protein n=1 Tax=Basidiobolus meristosporus CBS 931.73 TaxID=1314790 RepID=A0A1Y1Y0V6_9FUNG|nr:P-loop containing nucleoside triphosphate hydrolase protein [Basidiobolus meristosporus CBS 931.73]|eukprot:ORX91346.1 P-loop containing nucleoside triphosphate hydrolase protein [Basidiobolus meristosporus CBS 931.73]
MKFIYKSIRPRAPTDSTLHNDRPGTRVDINIDHPDEEVTQRLLEDPITDVLHIQGLTKTFPLSHSDQQRVVVDDLWLSLRHNECLGYLGPNGAGKTTTIEMLIGALSPTFGNATIEGYSIVPYSLELKQLLGVCQQSDILIPELTGREHLRLYASLRCPNNAAEAVGTIINEMTLQEVADQRVGTYSGGNKRRLSIAMAAVGNPKVLILDEPTAGVDISARKSIWEAIRKLKKSNSIILTTHSMEEADALCDRIGIIVKGRLAALGTPQRLKNTYGKGYKVSLQTNSLSTVEAAVQRMFQRFDNQDEQIRLLRRLGCHVVFEISGTTLGKIFRFLQEIKSPLDIVNHTVAQPTLTQVFVEFAKQQGVE